jgi:histidyl-tRNA synthetase
VKAQFKVADRSGARWTVVLGPSEVQRGVVTVKDLGSGEQREVERAGVVGALRAT